MSYETEDKMVSHPDHYKSGKYEVINIIDEFCKDLVGPECVCTANALKYILRWKKKNGIQDVKKAIWYLQHMVDIYEYVERDEKIVAETIEESFPTLHECFSCNDCKNDCPKDCPGIDDEPEPLNLRKNAAGVYIPEDTTKVTSAQVMYASKVITKYCNSMSSCDNCPFFDPDSNGVSCKFRLNSPNA